MILVSACLLGKNCKYNGGNNKNDAVICYLEGKEYVEICPEMFGGLPVPRLPAEIKDEKVLLEDGTDVTEEFSKGAEKALEIARKCGATEAILKESSPSCGCNTVYDGSHSGVKIPGMGITAKALLNMGISVKSEKDLEKETE